LDRQVTSRPEELNEASLQEAHHLNGPHNTKTIRNHMAKMRKEAKQRTVSLQEVLMHQPNAMNEARGKPDTARSLLQPMPLIVLRHPFGETLEEWRTGVLVNCGETWEMETIKAAVKRGLHQAARAGDAIALVHEDLAYQGKAGFSKIMLWDDIKNDLPPLSNISPVAIIPQEGQRGQISLDLSFAVQLEQKPSQHKAGKVLQEAVNDTTVPLAPQRPVQEIGKVLPQIFEFMASTLEGQDILLSKVDLLDGFWRIIVKELAPWNFCYLMPDPPDAPPVDCRTIRLANGLDGEPPVYLHSNQNWARLHPVACQSED
jgi:hypothetical protein